MRRGSRSAIGLLTATLWGWAVGPTYGGVVEYTDKDEWIAAVGAFTTIDFTGFPDGTFITDQYADLGVLFTDGDDNIACCSDITFPNDGAGLDGNAAIHLSFDTPEAYIAVDFPGDVQIDLYSGDVLFHSSVFIAGGYGNFAGVISSKLFDSVVISDPVFGDVFIDDLHFGVPAPPVIALLAVGTLRPTCRRRCSEALQRMQS